MEPDIVVVGAGPAGLLAAREAAHRGVGVLVLEEHEEIGVPDHCAGLLSISGLRSLGLNPPRRVVQNQVEGAAIYSPSGFSVHIERGRHEALVVDRPSFDKWLAELAMDAGAEIQTKTRVVDVKRDSGIEGVKTYTDSTMEIISSVVIDGEGSRCILSRMAGLPRVPRKSMLPAYQFEVRNARVHEDLVEMFYGNRIAPGFFAWIIPLGESRARVGLAARDKSKIRLQAAIRHHPLMRERLQGARIERGLGGTVLVGLPVARTYAPGFLVVGDAAGIVKATTGGGIIFGGGAAQIAGAVAAEYVKIRENHERTLSKYEHAWRARYGRDLKVMYLTQKVIAALSDKGLDALIKNATELGLLNTIKESGDMDRQGQVIFRLLRDPASMIAGFKVLRYVNLSHL